MKKLQESEIAKRLMANKALFADIHLISKKFQPHSWKKFDIVPSDNMHYGASIDYQDIQELRDDFKSDG